MLQTKIENKKIHTETNYKNDINKGQNIYK